MYAWNGLQMREWAGNGQNIFADTSGYVLNWWDSGSKLFGAQSSFNPALKIVVPVIMLSGRKQRPCLYMCAHKHTHVHMHVRSHIYAHASVYTLLSFTQLFWSYFIVVFMKNLSFAQPCISAKDEKYFPSSRSKFPSSQEGKAKYYKENNISEDREIVISRPFLAVANI